MPDEIPDKEVHEVHPSRSIPRAIIKYLRNNFSIKENALRELRARWGKPLKYYRARNDIASLFMLTRNTNCYATVDDATWQDLDLNDVFDRLDSNITPIGRQYLYRQLRTYESSEQALQQSFETAQVFNSDVHLREQTQLRLIALSGSNGSLITNMLFGPPPDGNFSKTTVYLLAATSLTTIATAIVNPSLLWLPILPMLANFVFAVKYADNIGGHSISFEYISKLLKVAARLAKMGVHTNLQQLDYLQSRRNSILKRRLDFCITGFDGTSTNPLVAQLAHLTNLICLFEFLAFMRTTKYLVKHKALLTDTYYAVASLDSAISIASYLSTNKELCNPVFCSANVMQFDAVVHPLLEKAVPNSYQSNENSALITGSNMAGKSTFIKTIGVNLILAQTLWICHARAACVPKTPVLSSIKKNDSLDEGKSYYFAEIEALLRLVNAANSQQPHVFLIDEILHGTNTVERVASSAAILDFLSNNNAVLVTSHDIELTSLLSTQYQSFHFQETADISNMFDYKIHNGHCSTRNAIALLEAIGFPASVISASRANATKLDG